MDWELPIGTISLFISAFTLYNQFHRTELIVYPLIRDTEVLLVLENSGNTLVRDFTIKLVDRTPVSDKTKERLEKMPFLNGKVEATIAAKTKREIPLGNYLQFMIDGAHNNDEKRILPKFVIEVKTKRLWLWHKTRTFQCDYNAYTREEIVHTSTYHLKQINRSIGGLYSQIKGIHDVKKSELEEIKKNRPF